MQSVDSDCRRCRRPRNRDQLPSDRARATNDSLRVSRVNVCGTFSSDTCPCEPGRRSKRDTREHWSAMFSGGRPDIFGISFDRAPVAAEYPLAKTWMSCPPNAFRFFFFISFSSLSLSFFFSFGGLSTCSHLRLWFYFISIRYRLLRISLLGPFIGHCLSLNFTLYFPHARNGLTQHRSAPISNTITINRPHFKVDNFKIYIFYKYNIYFIFFIIISEHNVSTTIECLLNKIGRAHV